MNFVKKSLLGFFLLAIFFACSIEKSQTEKPNVIIIYTDDQGAIDLNCYGAIDLITPNMDALVNSGVKFTQFYGAPVCSPSRAGLLTGKTPQRAGVPGNVSPTNPRSGMPGSEFTMAEMFKDAGYKTGHIGKWHLGHPTEKQPNAQGFDYSFGHLVGCIDNFSHYFYWNGPNRHDLFRNGEEVFYPGQFFPDLLVKEASAFMKENKDNPFFIYFALNTPHYPYQGTPEWLKYYQDNGVEYPRDLYAAFLSTQDDKIGELILKVEELGLLENTIIVFQSDNGYSTEERAHFGGGNAGVLRGSKSCLFEGGIRVPAAISWPAKIKAGEVRNQFAVNADWMPTLAELCGIDLKTSSLDGKSLVSIINDKNSQSEHINNFCWQHGKQWAARSGNWKLLGNPSIRFEEFAPEDSLFLVNLKDDPGEMTNLASENPEKVKELKFQFEKWLERN
ncbi:MAG: sulfatase-like hydrolase/transferase [Prolixibacteraceae bacterium]|jgi:arylsulfatase A|nr:sulfatase-like hydrolase/transferase [Prolixibacteraceae bacterium]MBT6005711.1 sulfatase-like hydrolase/transferase [Prolixibacteraceae bacterium]MBT7000538.1 sulfatase-like hydrolase/transferase [Prolixibacteraceae bacterium]MBT7393486.1 sulfatase-like hydrolase/transferase [Prolixibacteraceae bacterium]